MLKATVSEVFHSLGYHQCCIGVVRADDVIERVAWSGLAFSERTSCCHRGRVGDGILGRAARVGSTQRVNDVAADRDFIADPEGGDMGSELCVPIEVGGELWGLLNIEEPFREAFDEHDEALGEMIAAHIGAAIDVIRRGESVPRPRTPRSVAGTP